MAWTPPIDPYAPCHCGSGKKYKFCCLKTDREKGRTEQPHADGCGCPIDHGAQRAIQPKPSSADTAALASGGGPGSAL